MIFRILLLLLIVCLRAEASEQQPDLIYFNGKTYANNRYLYLLEPYFNSHPGRKPTSNIYSTGLRRGYVAIFEFKGWEMLLKEVLVHPFRDENYPSGLKGMDQTSYALGPLKKLKIDWFSGLVVLPAGTMFRSLDCYRCELYTEYTLFMVINGNVVQQRTLTYRQYKQCVDKHYEAYQQTPEYESDYNFNLANSYFESEDFIERYELWAKSRDNIIDTIRDPEPMREIHLRHVRFKKTSEYKKGYELWAKQPQAIFDAETKTRMSFEFSYLEPVIQDTVVMSYYIE